MRSSSIFKYIKTYLAPSDLKQYQAKVTIDRTTVSGELIKGGKHYFLCPITPSTACFSIEGREYHIREQHLSIYEKHQDTILGLEAYHLTVKLMHGATEFILHCYFDQHGNATDVMMKQGDATIELSEAAKKQFKEYGRQKARDRIYELNQLLFEKQTTLRAAYEDQEQKTAELSKDLKRHLKRYRAELIKLIDLVKELNAITNQSQTEEEKLLEEILFTCELKLSAGKKQNASKKIPSNKIAKSALLEAADSCPKLKEAPEHKATAETLETVNKKLALLKGDDLTTLKEQKRLLESKLKLTPPSDFNNVMVTLKHLKSLASQIYEATLNLALNGNIEAATTILTNNYWLPPSFYLDLITSGMEEVFDILFKACPFSIMLGNGRYGDTQSIDRKRRDLLTSAYFMRNERLFRKLLFTYHCNPNMTDISGLTLLHLVAVQGEITYAEMLLEAGTNLNISTKNPFEMKTLAIANPSKALGKQQLQNEEKKLHENIMAIMPNLREKIPNATPLIMAADASQDKMVRWLFEHKADVNLCGDDELDAMGMLAAKRGKPLHIPTFVALLEAGMSIDRVNTVLTATREQSNPLHYRCQWLDEDAVRLLVNQFAANPNVMVRKKVSVDGETLMMNCLAVAAYKSISTETQNETTNIMGFLLDQDIRPMIRYSLVSSIQISQMQAATLNTPRGSTLSEDEIQCLAQATDIALSKHEYTKFCQLSLKGIAANQSAVYRAIAKNVIKLDLVQAAEADLKNNDYKHCLNACETAHLAFKIKQYNERLWETWYRAYLGLGDDVNAYWTLCRYLDIVSHKSAQVLAPDYKTEMNKKIEKASTLLIEIHQRLLLKKATITAQHATMSFTAELKHKNMERLVKDAVMKTVLPQVTMHLC